MTIIGCLVHAMLRASDSLPISRAPRTRVLIFNSSRTHILLVRNLANPYTWTLPGGGYKPGEPAEQCAAREVQEELDIQIVCSKLTNILEHSSIKTKLEYHYLQAIIDNTSTNIKPSNEIIEAGWFDINNLPANKSSALRKIINSLL